MLTLQEIWINVGIQQVGATWLRKTEKFFTLFPFIHLTPDFVLPPLNILGNGRFARHHFEISRGLSTS